MENNKEKKSVKVFLEENKGTIIKIAVVTGVVVGGVLLVKYGLAKKAAKAIAENSETVEAVIEEAVV